MKRKIPGKKKLYRVGSGPHWNEANVLRRQLGCHVVLLAIVDEKGGVHVTGQTEPQSVALLGAASIALQELAHRIQNLALSPENWQAEEMSDARISKPPTDSQGNRVPHDLISAIPPKIIAQASLDMAPSDWTIQPPEKEKAD